jgi:hypothetical protein
LRRRNHSFAICSSPNLPTTSRVTSSLRHELNHKHAIAAGDPWELYDLNDLWRNGVEVFHDGDFSPGLMARAAIAFIEQNRAKPFFMYYAAITAIDDQVGRQMKTLLTSPQKATR